MLAAIVWGLIQGLTEFLPVSSSGHLVIIPAYLGELGFEIPAPSLAVSAVLHLGTLLAVLVYFRRDVITVLRMGKEQEGRRIALLVAVGTIPAAIGLPLEGPLDAFQDTVANVGWALIGTGVILVVGQRFADGSRALLDGRVPDAIAVGLAQALALIPGVSRAGSTITAGSVRGFSPTEAARFSFLLGIPAIAAAGLTQLPEVARGEGAGAELVVGFVVAAVAGYLAISALLAALRRIGLAPFAVYCLAVGLLTVIVF